MPGDQLHHWTHSWTKRVVWLVWEMCQNLFTVWKHYTNISFRQINIGKSLATWAQNHLRSFSAPKGNLKCKYVKNFKVNWNQNISAKTIQFHPQKCQINILYCIYRNHTYSCQHKPEQRWYLCVGESGYVRAEGGEVWAERDVVSEDSMFIPPWGEGCHCWIPVNEVWRPIPVSRIIQRYRSDVSNVDLTLLQ